MITQLHCQLKLVVLDMEFMDVINFKVIIIIKNHIYSLLMVVTCTQSHMPCQIQHVQLDYGHVGQCHSKELNSTPF
jgi:hypothetical protein